jgi:cation diffusion facilitator family transporter
MDIAQAARITRSTALLSVGVAGVLVALKLWAWLASGSVAMLSSLADSGLDAAASVFTLLAVTYAAKPPDAEHRHGHGKAEGFAAVFQAVLVGVSAALIANEAVRRLMNPAPVEATGLALAVMGVSVVLTLGLILAQSRAVAKTGSVATKGDRAHYAADLGANVVVITGIAAASLSGVNWLDPVAGFLVAGWLVYGAFDVAREGIDQLLDRELSDKARAEISRLAVDGRAILSVHQLRTRASGPYIHIQFHADLPQTLSLVEAHEAMVACEARIRTVFPAADIHIHPDPRGAAEDHGAEHFREEVVAP